MDDNNKNDFGASHLLLGISGTILGAWLVKRDLEESKKSRAEKDHPEDVDEVCTEIWNLLDEWQPSGCETEADFTEDLFGYLSENSEWEVEIYADTSEGKPDILVADLLALELKINPSKAERDRLIGQCAGYSRQWVTWAIVIGAKPSRIGKIEDLLADKGLDHILVLPYS